MPESLPVLNSTPPHKPSKIRNCLVHIGRLALVFSLALALRQAEEHRRSGNSVDQGTRVQIAIDDVLPLLPSAVSLDTAGDGGISRVRDGADEVVGRVLQTSPEADSIIGYRGPSNSLLSLDDNGTVLSARIISSQDTPEHVDAVLQDEDFIRQFVGWENGKTNATWEVDGTSGATLTSLSIAEGIAFRLADSAKPPAQSSLRFADALTDDDLLESWFDGPVVIVANPGSTWEVNVADPSGKVRGRLIRTGPLVDTLSGYQGPSEVTIALDPEGRVTGMSLRDTYDNETYVGYVRDESYFWKTFRGKTLEELAALDLEVAGVEGVSGATMTSVTVAETIVEAAKEYTRRIAAEEDARLAEQQRRKIRFSPHDIGTAVILCLAVIIASTGLRSIGWLRVTWLIILFVYFGLVTGNLFSQAVLQGWASSGIAWRLAPGLAGVLAVSLLYPSASKTNLYCSHVCPHGAAQQLIRSRLPWRLKVKGRTARLLSAVPTILLVAMFSISLMGLGWNLANWEPFNAYIWYISGVASIALATASLMVSAVLPMAYCRYGCPTGKLLDYIRFNAKSGSLTRADAICIALAASAWAYVVYLRM